jgi:hypothetical protein
MPDKYYRRGNKNHIVHTTFQDPETGLFEIEGKHLTKQQLDKLISITNHRWIIIEWKTTTQPLIKLTHGNTN